MKDFRFHIPHSHKYILSKCFFFLVNVLMYFTTRKCGVNLFFFGQEKLYFERE